MPKPDCHQLVKNKAVHLLSIREHGTVELARKLKQKHPDCANVIDDVLAELETVGYLNEVRYVEAFIRKEQALGHGLNRIRAALSEKGADADCVSDVLSIDETDWIQLARQVRVKKFGVELPTNRVEIAAQMRFLSYRGFDSDTIRYVLKNLSDD
jgi:regulatory protein